MRGAFAEYSKRFATAIATLTIAASGVLTFAAGATFKFTNQQPKAVLFTDSNQNATTSVALKIATTTNNGIDLNILGQLNVNTSTGIGINVTGTVAVTGSTAASITLCGGTSGACNALASAVMAVNQATGIVQVGGTGGSTQMVFLAGNVGRIEVDNTGMYPLADANYQLGAAAFRWNAAYLKNTYVSSTLFVSGTSTVNFASLTGNVVTKVELPLTAATNTPFAWQNTTGVPLLFNAADCYEASSTSVGNVQFNLGTSTDAFTTSTSPVINTIIKRNASRTANAATSTLLSAGGVIEAGEWFVGKTGNTSTNIGECMVQIQ